jgi:hypothetical protein
MTPVEPSLWQHIIQQVIHAGGHVIRSWFTMLEPISLEHGLLEIQVPGPAEQEYCRRHALRLFTEAAQRATGRLVGVCFLTAAEAARPSDEPSGSRASLAASDSPDDTHLLCEDYTFALPPRQRRPRQDPPAPLDLQ